MRFSKAIDDDVEGSWQQQELRKLEQRITELLVQNEDLKQKLEQKNFDEVYRENELLKMELKNMYALQEENKDLREDLERAKSLTYEERMKEVMEENQRLRRRNGELIIKLSDLELKMAQMETQDVLESELQRAHLKSIQGGSGPAARPQTAAGALMRKKEDMEMFDDDDGFFDKELTELIKRSQQSLAEL